MPANKGQQWANMAPSGLILPGPVFAATPKIPSLKPRPEPHRPQGLSSEGQSGAHVQSMRIFVLSCLSG